METRTTSKLSKLNLKSIFFLGKVGFFLLKDLPLFIDLERGERREELPTITRKAICKIAFNAL